MDIDIPEALPVDPVRPHPEPGSTLDVPTFPFKEEKKELERVIGAAEISRSASLVRFLTFICNKYFEGQADEIREFSIAVEALGRKESNFDSHVDPIVRVTARALRKKLGAYYATQGKNDPIRIVLPVGHYVPQFVKRPEPGDLAVSAEDSAALESGLPGADEEDEELIAPQPGRRRKVLWIAASIAIALPLVFLAGFFLGRHGAVSAVPEPEGFKWGEPLWSDEFEGAAQQLPDPAKWAYDTGNQSGWGNHEIEIYCSPRGENPKGCNAHRPNAFLDGAGHLVLRAERNADGSWTSARITTRGLKEFQYGRIEARMKLPVGVGIWPAFWMLGANFSTVGWPASGSVDIVESVSQTSHSNGLGPSMIRSTLHSPRHSGANGEWHDFKLPNGARVDDGGFHTYGIIWSPGILQFYFDDPANVYLVQTASEIPDGADWVFDHPFWLIMNLAVGGDWPGTPDANTPNPADVLVDYVRVYKIPKVQAPTIQWQPVEVKSGSAAASIISLHAANATGRVQLSCSTEPATAVCALASPVVDFSNTLSQEDALTISTDSFTTKGRMVSPPGRYKLTIVATTISGDRSQLTVPFEVKSGE